MPSELCDSLLRKELVADPLHLEDGVLPLPTQPGLGLELNEEALRRYRVS